MIRKKLLMLGTLMGFLIATGGCAFTGKDVAFDKNTDLVPISKGQVITAPVAGWFLSNAFYKFEQDRCK
jgi:hypothetical protein